MTAFPDRWAIANAVEIAEGIGGTVWRAHGAAGGVIVKQASALALRELPHAVAFLRLADGQGCVRLLDHVGEWQMLEDAGARTLLDSLGEIGDDAATRIAASVLRRIHSIADSGACGGLMPLTTHFASLHPRATSDGGLFCEAAVIATSLLAGDQDQPLHGDLHHDNILHGPRGWLAIDAKGLFGAPAYDAANLFYNPIESTVREVPERALRMSTILAEQLGHDRGHLLAWAFAHACLSASWHLEDGDAPEAARSLAVAEALKAARLSL